MMMKTLNFVVIKKNKILTLYCYTLKVAKVKIAEFANHVHPDEPPNFDPDICPLVFEISIRFIF